MVAFPQQPFTTDLQVSCQLLVERATLRYEVEGCQEHETNTYISGTPESCKLAVYRAAIVL